MHMHMHRLSRDQQTPTRHASLNLVYDRKLRRCAEDNRKKWLHAQINLNLKQLIIKDCARGILLLKLTTDRHEALHGLSATAELFVAPVKGSAHRNIVIAFGTVWKIVKICLFVSTEYTNTADRRTDTARRHRAHLHIASRGKKWRGRSISQILYRSKQTLKRKCMNALQRVQAPLFYLPFRHFISFSFSRFRLFCKL